VTWSKIPSIQADIYFTYVHWTGNKFVAVGNTPRIEAEGKDFETYIYTSVDGNTWEKYDPKLNLCFHGISSNGSEIFIVGDDGAILSSNDDGKSWKYESYTFSNGMKYNLLSIACNGKKFVIASGVGKVLLSK
jgi:photosystem II stability/assembly factor-like uncharacterized protein